MSWFNNLLGGLLNFGSFGFSNDPDSEGYQGTGAQSITDPASWWDNFMNGKTNYVNKQIAGQNLDFQKFALEKNLGYQYDALEYNKALNQQIFDRADTSYQRQAQDAQAIGINPMALAGSGGAEVGGSVSPIESMHEDPLHNDFQYQSSGIINAIAPILSVFDSINNSMTGNSQRDLLAQQADRQRLENMAFANEKGIDYTPSSSFEFIPESKPVPERKFQDVDLRNMTADTERNERVNENQKTYGSDDKSFWIEQAATDTAKQFGRFSNATKTILNGLKKVTDISKKSLKEKDKSKNKYTNKYHGSRKVDRVY